MKHKVTKVHPDDNVLVASSNFERGASIKYNGSVFLLPERVPAKHNFVVADMQPDDAVKM